MGEARANSAPTKTSGEGGLAAVHINARLGSLPETVKSVPRPRHGHSLPTLLSLPYLLGSVCGAVALLLVVIVVVRRRRRNYLDRKRLERMEEDEQDGFSLGSYRDDPMGDGAEAPVGSLRVETWTLR